MRYFIVCCILFFPFLSRADSIADLKAFITQSRSLSAEFTQTVFDQKGKKGQVSTGTLVIQRPGKFHWQYEKPYVNKIVGNGQKVWLYDPELKQVVIKKMHDAIDSSPAALLAGNNDFEKNYLVQPHIEKEKIHWLIAIPKSKESHFQQIRIGLQNKMLARIELIDQLGQMTTIAFTKMQLNPVIKESEFNFIVPKDTDVISE